jgi:putative hydrolase of the HAD superfamily
LGAGLAKWWAVVEELIASRPQAVLVDVGGTLWPNAFPLTPALQDVRAQALAEVLGSDRAAAAEVATAIDEGLLGEGGASSVDSAVARSLGDHGFSTDHGVLRQARRAMCVPFAGALAPFKQAGALLAGIKSLGLRCVVISNTVFRDAEMYRRDFEAEGWARWVDAYVTSVDVGARKPDERIFRAALAAAGPGPDHCVMIGDSEAADMVPAARLGMRTVLVAIERPVPRTTVATTCVTSLGQALDALRVWAAGAA